MADDNCISKNDDGLILLNDGSSCILLNTQIEEVGGGVVIEGTHATPLIGPRAEQLIPVEFSFILKACLITKTLLRICVKSPILIFTKANVKVKSAILNEVTQHYKFKSTLFVKEFIRIKMKSATLVRETVKAGIFANAKNKKLKEVLLRKLKEYLEDG